ncbi:hypothetical protein [Achromobacter phage Motura]|uniref:Uncharacterized protein n=1 Tax=Achromobacter phage Motura TaxID=2591403 RepID=A0A514CSZ4_9CAUD|nr:hypothetical protein H1O15_gp202 [Achromobacter phage Motura]QDH83586.1 hypothetical protein [Achromobacter phage Motura]
MKNDPVEAVECEEAEPLRPEPESEPAQSEEFYDMGKPQPVPAEPVTTGNDFEPEDAELLPPAAEDTYTDEEETSASYVPVSWYRVIAVTGMVDRLVKDDPVERTKTFTTEPATISIVVQTIGNIVADFQSVKTHLGAAWSNVRLLSYTELPTTVTLEQLKDLGFNQ